MRLKTAILSILIATSQLAIAQESKPLYKDSSQDIEFRVKDLVSRMTLEEKFWQLFMIPGDIYDKKHDYSHGIFGFQVSTKSSTGGTSEQILNYNVEKSSALATAEKINDMQRYFVEETRLGIPIIPFDEALHGLVRDEATCFPASIAMAASWNEPLMHEVSTAIATETKARGIRDILSPVVNLANDVRWGRTEETYGEDPYLSARMGVAFVSEFEKRGVITTPKHYIANVADGGRDSYPVNFSEQHIRETHLVPFAACVQEGGSRSIMSAYNVIDGTPASASKKWLREVLKGDLSFDGFVISDAGAVGGINDLHDTAESYAMSGAQAIEGGLDVIFQTSYDHYPLFKEAFDKGMITPAAIDEAVSRVLRAKFELGLFENPYVDLSKVEELTHTQHNVDVARQMAAESFVLLKNNDKLLPLNGVKSVALIGHDVSAARMGGYSGPAENKISILDGFKQVVGNKIKVNHAEGVSLTHSDFVVVPESALSTTFEGEASSGLSASYYANPSFEGEPVLERIDRNMSFGWTLFSPQNGVIPYDNYSVVWNGKIKATESGRFNIGMRGNDGYRLYIDGKLIVDNFKKVSFGTHTAPFNFVKGREYDIKIEYYETIGNVRLALVWDMGADNGYKQQIARAVSAARSSDVAVVTMGLVEGEANDRALLSAQGKQIDMLNAVIATGKPVVVLIVGGSAMTMQSWGDKVDAIMQVWYPGEQGGIALAEVLTGKVSPSGKLPITLPVHEGQLPLIYNHKPTGRIDDYVNLTGQPLYPFGYGLSYSEFTYSDLSFSKSKIGKNDSVEVSCTITNSGSYEAKEVVQLYVRDLISSVTQPIIALKGFKKISVKPGESQKVTFVLNPSHLALLNEHMEWVVEPGEFRVMVGASSKDIRLRGFVEVE